MWHQIGCWQDHLLVQVRLGTPRGAHPGVKSGFLLCSGGTHSSRRDHEDGPALFMAFYLRESACPTIKKEKKGKLYTVSDTLNPALSCWNAASLWSLIWSDPCPAQSWPSNSKTVGMRLQDHFEYHFTSLYNITRLRSSNTMIKTQFHRGSFKINLWELGKMRFRRTRVLFL